MREYRNTNPSDYNKYKKYRFWDIPANAERDAFKIYDFGFRGETNHTLESIIRRQREKILNYV